VEQQDAIGMLPALLLNVEPHLKVVSAVFLHLFHCKIIALVALSKVLIYLCVNGYLSEASSHHSFSVNVIITLSLKNICFVSPCSAEAEVR